MNSPGYVAVAPWAMWLAAARPRTLVAGAAPVAVGLCVARLSGPLDHLLGAMTLAAALALQVATNLANDYYDWERGIDTEERLGPTRVTQAGLLAPAAVRRAMVLAFAVAGCVGLRLVAAGGWPIVAIGLVSMGAALGYSWGPWPLASHALGELLALVFFGVVAVCGTVYLQSGTVDATALLASFPVGCLAAALIVVNNLRDIATDRVAAKRTLAVRIGDRATRCEYLVLVVAAFALLGCFAALVKPAVAIVLAALPLALREIGRVWRRRGAELNDSLAASARLYLVVAVLFVAGLLA